MRKLLSSLVSRRVTRNSTGMMEALEDRQMLAAAPPHVIGIVADNRGFVSITLDAAISSASVKALTQSVQIYVGATRMAVGVSYSATTHVITASAGVAPDKLYKVRLIASMIKGATGLALDGEFHGATTRSGNGKAGGDFMCYSKASADKVARFTTTLGIVDVHLFTTQTPLTVGNFLDYANGQFTRPKGTGTIQGGAWDITQTYFSGAQWAGTLAKQKWIGQGYYDNSWVTRNVANFVVQGGGYSFFVDSNNKLQVGATLTQDPVPNEPNADNPGNIAYTIAMAKVGAGGTVTADQAANSATSEWFFNVADNRSNLDDQNGGFTVFGQVTDPNSQRVIRSIAGRKDINLNPTTQPNYPFGEVPSTNTAALKGKDFSTLTVADLKNLIFIKRVAVLNDILAIGKSRPAAATFATQPIKAQSYVVPTIGATATPPSATPLTSNLVPVLGATPWHL